MLPVRPSETTDYLRCPRYWQYKHVDGWQAPPSAWEPWQLMGTAIHAGVAAYWSKVGREAPIDAVKTALAIGWPPGAPPEFSREGSEAQALKVLDSTLKWIAKNMVDAQPVMVEQTLRANGCTPDLVTREQTGLGTGLVVTDWKTHWNLDADRVRYRLEGLDRTHQFLDYAWQVGQTLGEPVQLVRKVAIVGSPRILVREGTFVPTQPMLEQWLTSARQTWHDMGKVRAGERGTAMNPNGCKMYGDKYPCTYFEACWTCYGEETRMNQFLVRR